MNESNMLLKNIELTAGQKVSKLVSDHPVIATLTVVGVIVGLTILLAKSDNYSDTDRYTEFDTNY